MDRILALKTPRLLKDTLPYEENASVHTSATGEDITGDVGRGK